MREEFRVPFVGELRVAPELVDEPDADRSEGVRSDESKKTGIRGFGSCQSENENQINVQDHFLSDGLRTCTLRPRWSV
jgi:hypothetical protein